MNIHVKHFIKEYIYIIGIGFEKLYLILMMHVEYESDDEAATEGNSFQTAIEISDDDDDDDEESEPAVDGVEVAMEEDNNPGILSLALYYHIIAYYIFMDIYSLIFYTI